MICACRALIVSVVHGFCVHVDFWRCRLDSVYDLVQLKLKLPSEDAGCVLTNVLSFVFLAPDGPYW